MQSFKGQLQIDIPSGKTIFSFRLIKYTSKIKSGQLTFTDLSFPRFPTIPKVIALLAFFFSRCFTLRFPLSFLWFLLSLYYFLSFPFFTIFILQSLPSCLQFSLQGLLCYACFAVDEIELMNSDKSKVPFYLVPQHSLPLTISADWSYFSLWVCLHPSLLQPQ